MYKELKKRLERPCNYIVQRPGDRWTKVDIYDVQEAIKAITDLTRKLADMTAERDAALSRLAEYDAAESEGRRPVLPCKSGDTLYVLCGNGIMETTVTNVTICADNVVISTHNKNAHGIMNIHEFFACSIGTTLFLTHAEAVAAMEKGEGE